MKLIPIAFLALLAHALPAAAQQLPGCADGQCSASGLSAQSLSELARQDVPTGGVRDELRSPARPADPWNRAMPNRPDLESYECALSFGIGGELGKGGFLGTRALGRTQVIKSAR